MGQKNALVSCLPGRIRLRHPALRAGRCNAELQAALHALDGALVVEPDLTVGSVLFQYDLTRCDPRSMETQVSALCERALGDAPQTTRTPSSLAAVSVKTPSVERRRLMTRQFNRTAKIAMLASFPLSLVLAALGKKRLHAITGGIFTLFLLVHLSVHRRALSK